MDSGTEPERPPATVSGQDTRQTQSFASSMVGEKPRRVNAGATGAKWTNRTSAAKNGLRQGRLILGGMATAVTETHLSRILASTRARVEQAKIEAPLATLERQAARHQPRGWAAALRRQAAHGPAVIAEIKKASPSKGLIRADFDVAWLAGRYQAGGAAALSVLTDEPYFQGSLRNLEIASETVSLPCLRKDFMVDTYQVVEAQAHGADAILLIAAALDDSRMLELARAGHAMGLDVFAEVHDGPELERVLAMAEPPEAIGVNNRDLRSFAVRLETSLELVERIPPGVVRVAESGISSGREMARLRAAGFHAFLIGESLMRAADPGAALVEMLDNRQTGQP